MLIAGDIGGTKTDLAVYAPESGPRTPLAQARYQSADYDSLETMIKDFLAKVNLPVKRGCFDVAGPVVEGKARLTNLPWLLDEQVLQESLGLSQVHLLNDLEAIAYAVPHLGQSDLHTLNAGTPVNKGALGVIAPGTGLGEAFLTWDGMRYQPYPSEGGHCNFAPTSPLEMGLLEYLLKKYETVSYERVCSGIGIPNIYDYLRDSGYAEESPEVARQMSETKDRTRLICELGQDQARPSVLCYTTLQTFMTILATEAGNLALKLLSTGGIYIGGGIPVHILQAINTEEFLKAFRRKGRFTDLLSRIPVHIITTSAPLIGAASYGLEIMYS